MVLFLPVVGMLRRYAMLGHEPGPMLLLAVARQALLQLDSFSPQELTNMVSAPCPSYICALRAYLDTLSSGLCVWNQVFVTE